MQTASEIESAVNNMKYYTQKIKDLSKQQFELDMELKDINTQVGSIRFDCLGAIGASCQWIDVYTENIISNLQVAVKQDKLLHTEEDSN